MSSHGTIDTDGCSIRYWYQGTGPLLIFVPGGNGHGRQFNAIMGLLDSHFTVATFDRRQMSASTAIAGNRPLNPAQQARDIIAVMKAIGYTTTSLFTSSSGGINGLQLAVSYPEVLDHLVLHETPTSSLLSAKESTEIMDFFFSVQDIYRESGHRAAMETFARQVMVGMEDEVVPRQTPEEHNVVNQFDNEWPWPGIYCPDLQKVKENGTSVAVGYGVKSGDALYAKATIVQAQRLGCERVEFPGHHQGFETEAEAFSVVLKAVLERMERNRREERK